jgi:pimeloyl-ACP methyl ester carboxylesterase
VWQAVANTRCPTLIVYGGRDQSWTDEGARRAFVQMPATTPHAFLRLAEMGHTPSTRTDLEFLQEYVLAWFARYLARGATRGPIHLPTVVPAEATFEAVSVD